MKFGRIYRMSVQGQYFPEWSPAYPTTLEFDVQRNTFASANTGRFTLFNLEARARKDIYFDRWVSNQRLKVRLQAGYVGQMTLPTIFQGDIRVAWTERRGPNWITQIEAFDGGYALYNAQAEGLVIPANATMQQAAQLLVGKMNPFGVTLGKVSKISLQNTRPIPCAGNAWDELQRLVPGDGQLFIDGGVANILNPSDYLPTPTVPTISAATGLLNTPRQHGNLRTVSMIFDPQYAVGQLVALNSVESWMSAPALKVVGLHHYGTISGVESGDCITELSLLTGYGKQPLTPVDDASEGMIA